MKVCLIQPPYSTDYSRSDELFRWEIEALDGCRADADIIVMPESCDVPCLAKDADEMMRSVRRYREPLMKKLIETAVRCCAVVFCNLHDEDDKGVYNTTVAVDRFGNIAGKYRKQHLTAKEESVYRLEAGYTYEYCEAPLVVIDGIRYCFLTCYDFYFYEEFPQTARQKPDIIIGCSHQRSDRQSALETMSRFLAYNTNAWVVRSSVSMGSDSDIGGGSCVVSPDGETLLDMKSRIGTEYTDIDPSKKYFKPAGFGNPPSAHYEYIEKGRRPWKYRHGGSTTALTDEKMPYPRVCAHRGFNTIAPENSMPAFGAAVAMGAEEIEFDLWPTKDGEIVSVHDAVLDRVSDGSGLVTEHTLEELRRLDFGYKTGERFRGLRILTFEDILKKLSGQTVMNIHIKTANNSVGYDREIFGKIAALIYKYDAEKWSYFMCGNDNVQALAMETAPDICRCIGGGDDPWGMVNRAVRYKAKKIQLVKGKFDQKMIDDAHALGIRCNVFWSDDPDETRRYLDMGIDTILTNDYGRISEAVREYREEKGK